MRMRTRGGSLCPLCLGSWHSLEGYLLRMRRKKATLAWAQWRRTRLHRVQGRSITSESS